MSHDPSSHDPSEANSPEQGGDLVDALGYLSTSAKQAEIAFINESTVVSDTEAQNVMNALSHQANNEFKAVWDVGCKLVFVPKGGTVPANMWWLGLFDNSDQAGALGYHDLTPEGLPLGKVFCQTDIQYKVPWSTTASHELLEMLGDPWIMACVQITNSSFVAQETADACENDSYVITPSGGTAVEVSDFVHPAWFITGLPASTQYDHLSVIKQPLALRPGGYIGYWTPTHGWQQRFGNSAGETVSKPAHSRQIAPVGSRRERRARGRENWIKSNLER